VKRVVFSGAAKRDLAALPPTLRKRIVEKLERYAATGAGQTTKLVRFPAARLRVGDYRVIFTEADDEIRVGAIGHRREIYR
jgi:mRNA interferase RelE/StbE